MRTPIRVLPKDLAEKIAAGEVVERPVSVIKELVENSLDAGARHIRVEIADGGRRRIAVLDDGLGIPPAELETALERHATSKIAALDDLWNLRTMGFRGEALPSIAAVSRFSIASRTSEERVGRGIGLEGGRMLVDAPIEATSPLGAFQSGTLVTVEDLFFNVPARLKFLKSKSAEAAQVRELLERIALPNPGVAFTLASEGRKTLALEAGAPSERFAQVIEAEASSLEEVSGAFEDIVVRGWVDRDTRAPNSRHVYLSVNGRMVRDKLLQQAVLVALRPRMMEGEYPRVFLSVDVDPADVDVNVHPAKSEVRFRRARDVFHVVHGALERLAKAPSRPFYLASLPRASVDGERAAGQQAAGHGLPATEPDSGGRLFSDDRVSYRTKSTVSLNIGGLTAAFEAPPAAETRPEPGRGAESVRQSPGFQSLHYLGQLKNTYLLFQDATGLVIVDQHAAHERVNYEKLKGELLAEGLRPQPLLISAVVKCKPEDIAAALDASELLGRLGFEFEAFGESCLLVRAAPAALDADRAAALFKTLLEELRDPEATALGAADNPSSLARLSPKLERMLSTSACHASVRAGQALSPAEARELAVQLDATEASLNCPHGRPASVKLTFSQVEALFKR